MRGAFALGAAALLAAAAPPPPAPASDARLNVAAPAIRCGEDSCAGLLVETLPTDLARVSRLRGRKIGDVPEQELCTALIYPSVGVGDDTPDSLCGNLRVSGGFESETGRRVLRATYGRDDYDTVGFRFRPSDIYSEKLVAYQPCFSPFVAREREKGMIPDLSTWRHPFFEEDPDRENRFRCGYVLSGYALPVLYHTIPLPEWASPIGAIPVGAEHLALILAPLGDVEIGEEVLGHLLRLADSEADRARLCAGAEACVAPRRLVLPSGPFADAIAYCSHRFILGEYQLPTECQLAAVKLRATGEWLLQALISPQTAFPSGNGVGDASIVCKAPAKGTIVDALKKKFAPTKGYAYQGNVPLFITRKGHVSEVYTSWRENLVIQVIRSGGDVLLTPTIFFSVQNPQAQEDFTPISVKQYDYYVKKLIARLSPDLACVDGRK